MAKSFFNQHCNNILSHLEITSKSLDILSTNYDSILLFNDFKT